MIIQTGMRTDIPEFYPEWLINRIKEGDGDIFLEKSVMMIELTNYHNYDKIMIIYKGGIVYDSNQTCFGLEKQVYRY